MSRAFCECMRIGSQSRRYSAHLFPLHIAVLILRSDDFYHQSVGGQYSPRQIQRKGTMMKIPLAVACVWMVCAMGVSRLEAQDPLDVAPEMYRLLFENERVRVMEVTFQPGQSIKPHSHPDHYVYVAEGGKLRISHPDGTSMDAALNVGDVVWIPAETHWAENIGDSVVRLIVNELKEPPPAKAHEKSAESEKAE